MLIHLEISKPFQSKPWLFRSNVGWRIGWLWFALGANHLRYDELLSGGYIFQHKSEVPNRSDEMVGMSRNWLLDLHQEIVAVRGKTFTPRTPEEHLFNTMIGIQSHLSDVLNTIEEKLYEENSNAT